MSSAEQDKVPAVWVWLGLGVKCRGQVSGLGVGVDCRGRVSGSSVGVECRG